MLKLADCLLVKQSLVSSSEGQGHIDYIFRELPVWCMGRCHANHVLVAFFLLFFELFHLSVVLSHPKLPANLLADIVADTRHIFIHNKMNKICSMLRVYPSI